MVVFALLKKICYSFYWQLSCPLHNYLLIATGIETRTFIFEPGSPAVLPGPEIAFRLLHKTKLGQFLGKVRPISQKHHCCIDGLTLRQLKGQFEMKLTFVFVSDRVAEPENLKTVPVPVPTFYLNTVPVPAPAPVPAPVPALVPAPVPGHIHAYTCTYTYTCICVYLRKRIHMHILNIYIY